jgi:hypothetical protein
MECPPTATDPIGFGIAHFEAVGGVEIEIDDEPRQHVRLRCPHSGTMFARRLDALLDSARHVIGCPGCGVSSRIPSTTELHEAAEHDGA